MKLLDYLPDYYKGIKEMEALTDIEDSEVINLKSKIQDMLNQKFVDSATWGLEWWEEELGLSTNPESEWDERRSKIKGKLRGTGKVGADLIKEVADSWTHGDVEVTFDGAVNIKFNSVFGIPSNMKDVKDAVNKIKPCHLSVVYFYAYLLISDIHNVITINEIESYTLEKFAGGEY